MPRRFDTRFPLNKQLATLPGTPKSFSHFLVAEVFLPLQKSDEALPFLTVRIPVCVERDRRILRALRDDGLLGEHETVMGGSFDDSARALTSYLLHETRHFKHLPPETTDPLGFETEHEHTQSFLYKDPFVRVEASVVPRKKRTKKRRTVAIDAFLFDVKNAPAYPAPSILAAMENFSFCAEELSLDTKLYVFQPSNANAHRLRGKLVSLGGQRLTLAALFYAEEDKRHRDPFSAKRGDAP